MIPYDPFIRYGIDDNELGHPMLPAGWNSAPLNGDEVNGPGLNEVRVPVTCVSDEFMPPIVLQQSDFDFLLCASMNIPSENRTIGIQHENRTVLVTGRCA